MWFKGIQFFHRTLITVAKNRALLLIVYLKALLQLILRVWFKQNLTRLMGWIHCQCLLLRKPVQRKHHQFLHQHQRKNRFVLIVFTLCFTAINSYRSSFFWKGMTLDRRNDLLTVLLLFCFLSHPLYLIKKKAKVTLNHGSRRE